VIQTDAWNALTSHLDLEAEHLAALAIFATVVLSLASLRLRREWA